MSQNTCTGFKNSNEPALSTNEMPDNNKFQIESVQPFPRDKILHEKKHFNFSRSDSRFWRTYKVVYLGYAVLDRRYTLPMLPWVIAEIKRHGSQNVEDIYIEVTDISLKAINCENNHLVFVHKLHTISKFAQSSHDSSCFTYMTREVVNGPCAYHVFQAVDETTVIELFTTLREATKEILSHQSPSRTTGSVTINSEMISCQQYEVLYLGRIKVSGKRAPPTFIDDVVEKFRVYEAEKIKNFKDCRLSILTHHGSAVCCDCNTENVLSSLSSISHCAQLHKVKSPNQVSDVTTEDEPSESYENKHKELTSHNNLNSPSLITHSQSLDSPGCADIVRDLNYSDPSVMLRDSESFCSDLFKTKQTSLPAFYHKMGDGGTKDLIRPRSYTSPSPSTSQQQNRTMLFIIGRSEICLIGMDKKQVLLRKAFNDISHCSQGVKHLEHFGFISRETTLSGGDCYAGYIFRCQTEKLVDEIMSTLKQAFKQAHQSHQNLPVQAVSVPKIIICDACPMQWFHNLCSDVEELNSEDTHLSILEKLGTLADEDKERIMVKFQNSNFTDIQDQNEILMMLLREFCEQRQMKHLHISHENANDKSDSVFLKEKYSKLVIFRQKAAKSLSNSFESFLKLTNKVDGKVSPSSVGKVLGAQDTYSNNRDLYIGYYGEESHGDCHTIDTLSPILARPRSSTFSSSREKFTKGKSNHQFETPKKRPIANMLKKSVHQNVSYSTYEESPKGSWRQAIFHKVQTPVSNKHVLHALNADDDASSKSESRSQTKSKEELRALWKKAIIEQILLIRMEKENKKLQVNQDVASHKRMKLNYKEINPCLKSVAAKWAETLNHFSKTNEVPNQGTLTDLVKSGIPRHKRGEIWQFLARCNKNVCHNYGNSGIDLSTPYDDLLKQLTSHQHSILIDIGRTFPNHPFYSQSLGSGQLSLFNLLKAYSLLDKDVGYCQGISFVAGILLLHMPEESAFELMTHLMFNLGLRRQYKTDMVAFQIQMYQLSRLIHDNHRDLYDHLEKFDVAPTLYAAPWFLTLFASQFPVGFVSRLLDLIFLNGLEIVFKVSVLLLGNYKKDILSCESFESIMEYLKGTLPSIDIIQMEIIFNQVFSLDIGRQLHAYEVEYHVLLEEMVQSPSKNDAEFHNLITANRNLKAQNMELMEQLQVTYSRIHALEASETSLKSSVHRLETRVANLVNEKEALVHSLNIMKHRLEKEEVSRIDGTTFCNNERRHPTFGIVYTLAGSEKEEDEQFKQLMKTLSQVKENPQDEFVP